MRKSYLNYLKFPSLLKDLPKHPFSILCDSEADVMHIDFYNPPQNAEDSELTDDDKCLEEYFGDTDLNTQIRPEIKDQLKASLAQTQAGTRGIKLETIGKLVNTNS